MTEPQPGGVLDPGTAVSVGRIAGVHGVHGDLKVEPLTDFPERFQRGVVLWLDGEPHSIERARWQRQAVVLKLARIETREEAARLRGRELFLPEPGPLPEGEPIYYQHDVIGLLAKTETGEALGRVEDILSTGSNDVYVVRGERGELLLPAIEDVIRRVDIPGGELIVDLLPGLEFRAKTQGVPRKRGGGSRGSQKKQ
jgi:16S rRNA processing protein RimM